MDVKLFDVDVNDAAVASSLVNVTSVPTLILIPPVPPNAATSHGHSTMCAAIVAPVIPAPLCFALTCRGSYSGPLAVHDCLEFVRKEVAQLLDQRRQ